MVRGEKHLEEMIAEERKIQRLFRKGCAGYRLLEDGDRILIALSGGKDSLELVRLLAAQQRIYKPRIEVEAAHVLMDNIPYETDRSYIQRFCEELGVRLHILHASFEERSGTRKPRCFLCSWTRRKTLFEFAVENGFNKIALGHHQDDILVTLLMNMTFEGSMQTMPPRLEMDHYPVTVIRPLCLVPEHLIKTVAETEGFERQKTACPYEQTTRRQSMTEMFRRLEEMNPEARYSLWNSMRNIHHDLLP